MSNRDKGPQFDFGLRKDSVPSGPSKVSASIVPFVDAATQQVRRDAMRRVAANRIFAPHRGKD
jgi:hypothetical protein